MKRSKRNDQVKCEIAYLDLASFAAIASCPGLMVRPTRALRLPVCVDLRKLYVTVGMHWAGLNGGNEEACLWNRLALNGRAPIYRITNGAVVQRAQDSTSGEDSYSYARSS